jgi:secondary thiamine-phosphate synthase enzyme
MTPTQTRGDDAMTVSGRTISLRSKGNNDVIDLTEEVAGAVKESEVRDGIATVFVPGSTAGITTVEYERGMIADLKRFLDEAVPEGRDYAHNHGGDSNGHAHIRAALLGPSVSVPVSAGELTLGTWQQIVLVDCDDRPRSRKVLVQIVGE